MSDLLDQLNATGEEMKLRASERFVELHLIS